MQKKPVPGLLVLPGWDDNGRQQFEGFKACLERDGWICKRADLPDANWSTERRAALTRDEALRHVLYDYDDLAGQVFGGPVGVLGFSFGAYIGAFLAANRPVQFLILRSPALYPDEDWMVPKEQLDKNDLDAYRHEKHGSYDNKALDCCSRFSGDVLLIDSEKDEVIPRTVIASYETAFAGARSLTRHTLAMADHPLTDPAWQAEYRNFATDWLGRKLAALSATTG